MIDLSRDTLRLWITSALVTQPLIITRYAILNQKIKITTLNKLRLFFIGLYQGNSTYMIRIISHKYILLLL